MKKSLLVIFLVLFIDQCVKIWIKTHMFLGEQFPVINNLLYIHFTENYGMAFGFELEGSYGKLVLSIFRIFAISGIGYYLYYLIKHKSHQGLILCISLIMAGAIGNILDSAFYGLLFSESNMFDKAMFLPETGGYAGFLHGAVVDMFYFNTSIDKVFWSDEQPYNLSFAIFNISDAVITIGVVIIFLFQKKFFKDSNKEQENTLPAQEASTGDSHQP